MIRENLLWARTIDPVSGRVEKQHTVLMVALIIIVAAPIIVAAFCATVVMCTAL